MMELSKRLQAVADLLSEGLVVADVGTDHGYIPIYLLESGKSPKAFAMDINEGPLIRAKEHIAAHHLSEKIEIRQSDGVRAIKPNECEAVVVAGMGGALAVKIMDEGVEVFKNLKEFILQPQSELEKVRIYLYKNGYRVVDEDMVLEDGKYYPMMKVVCGKTQNYSLPQLRYGKILLQKKHPILQKFLVKELQVKEEIVKKLQAEKNPHIAVRLEELREEILCIKDALSVYNERISE